MNFPGTSGSSAAGLLGFGGLGSGTNPGMNEQEQAMVKMVRHNYRAN
jgi:import inner membrane translocase subunit TIM22